MKNRILYLINAIEESALITMNLTAYYMNLDIDFYVYTYKTGFEHKRIIELRQTEHSFYDLLTVIELFDQTEYSHYISHSIGYLVKYSEIEKALTEEFTYGGLEILRALKYNEIFLTKKCLCLSRETANLVLRSRNGFVHDEHDVSIGMFLRSKGYITRLFPDNTWNWIGRDAFLSTICCSEDSCMHVRDNKNIGSRTLRLMEKFYSVKFIYESNSRLCLQDLCDTMSWKDTKYDTYYCAEDTIEKIILCMYVVKARFLMNGNRGIIYIKNMALKNELENEVYIVNIYSAIESTDMEILSLEDLEETGDYMKALSIKYRFPYMDIHWLKSSDAEYVVSCDTETIARAYAAKRDKLVVTLEEKNRYTNCAWKNSLGYNNPNNIFQKAGLLKVVQFVNAKSGDLKDYGNRLFSILKNSPYKEYVYIEDSDLVKSDCAILDIETLDRTAYPRPLHYPAFNEIRTDIFDQNNENKTGILYRERNTLNIGLFGNFDLETIVPILKTNFNTKFIIKLLGTGQNYKLQDTRVIYVSENIHEKHKLYFLNQNDINVYAEDVDEFLLDMIMSCQKPYCTTDMKMKTYFDTQNEIIRVFSSTN